MVVAQPAPDVQFCDLWEDIFPLLSTRPRQLLPLADAEDGPHHYYGGLLGHGRANVGGCFMNLRNVLMKDDVLYAKVGVGVLRESSSYRELMETRDKISGVMEAVDSWAAMT